MVRGVLGVRKSIDQCWLAKGLGLGFLCWGFKGVQEEIHGKEANTLRIRSVAFPVGQCASPELHPCHRLFDKDGHQDSSSASQVQTLLPVTFAYSLSSRKNERLSLWYNWGDERDCDEGHWHAHTRGLPWGLPEVVGTYIAAGGDYFEKKLEFYVCTINKSAQTKKIWKLIWWSSYIYIYIYIYTQLIHKKYHLLFEIIL